MTACQDTPADLVVAGGTVLTFDARARRVGALAVRGDRVAAVGRDDDVAGLIGAGTTVIDLAGRAVIPGINDSHLHATWLGATWPATLMGGGPTVAPRGRLVTGSTQRRAAILRAGEICAALGITSYTEPGLGSGEDDGVTGCFSSEVLEEYATLAAEGALSARVTVLRLFGALDGPSDIDAFERGIRTDVPASDPTWLNVAGVKIFADGIPPMRTAWTRHHYADGTRGRLLVRGPDDTERERNLRRMIEGAHARGMQVGVHATGDRAIGAAIDGVAGAVRRYGPGYGAGGRHYVIHGDLVAPAHLTRMAELGMGLTVQPAIANATAGQVARELGEGVARAAWPLADMLARDMTLTLSSDAPILGPDWRAQIAAAADLLSSGGEADGLTERLLRRYTTEPARQDGAESWKGSLAPGKVADFCVLSTDPSSIGPAELPQVAVDATVVGGRVVFRRQGHPDRY